MVKAAEAELVEAMAKLPQLEESFAKEEAEAKDLALWTKQRRQKPKQKPKQKVKQKVKLKPKLKVKLRKA